MFQYWLEKAGMKESIEALFIAAKEGKNNRGQILLQQTIGGVCCKDVSETSS